MSSDTVKLHLGCFDDVWAGWINTDITPHIALARIPGLARVLHRLGLLSAERYRQHLAGIFRQMRRLNVNRRFPFHDGTVTAVYSSHLLNNLEPVVAARCVHEIHRVLKPGGEARFAVPDLDRVIREYDPQNVDAFLTGFFQIQQKWNKNKQHWHYNELSLGRLLQAAGFSFIRRCAFRQGATPDIARFEKRDGSLFMEATK